MTKTAYQAEVGHGSTRPVRRRAAGVWVCLATIVVVIAYAVLVPVFASPEQLSPDLSVARMAPSWRWWFGTDQSGHDLLVRIALALRVSLLIAAACAVISTVLGMIIGTTAAVFGGWVDSGLMRFSDTLNALPHLLLGIVILAMWPGSVTAIIASIAATHWSSIARLVRSEALTIRSMEYVEAAYLAGASRWEVLRRHLLPSTLGQGLIGVVLLLPHAIWHESALSFLGLGLSPDLPSLGTLLAQSRGEVLLGGWWTLVFPALPLIAITLAVAGLAEALQRMISPTIEAREVTS